MNKQRSLELALIVAITFFAFALRLWQIEATPPGWRDDEIINSLVISQHVLDGDYAVYYADASGHEALYHALNALFLGLFGATVWGIRYLSVILGTFTVPLTYLLGRKLFGSTVGLVAAAGLAVSFWALMYSRIGLRHVLMPPLTLASFYFFWRGFEMKNQRLEVGDWKLNLNFQSPISNFTISALFMGLGFYTYFASRGLPLILGAFLLYAALVAWPFVKRKWLGLMGLFALALVLAVPLLLTLQQQPESEARVAELAVPLVALGEGHVAPLLKHVVLTLGMFVNSGDGEWLYNIPNRPVLTGIGAVFFWLGVALTAVFTLLPLWHKLKQWLRHAPAHPAKHGELASAFLLIWWVAGISPAFISVPPASLGHTILAQPAVFILAALPLGLLSSKRVNMSLPTSWQTAVTTLLAFILIGSIAARDWPDYFVNWPERGMVRFLYRADLHELASYVNANEHLTDFGVNSFLAARGDQLAFASDLRHEDARPRWFNAERAVLLEPALSFTGYPQTAVAYPDNFQPTADSIAVGDFTLTQSDYAQSGDDELICFENGLCLQTAVYHPEKQTLDLTWHVSRELDLPEQQLISNPPPPGVYAGPRLLVFAQLLDAQDNYIVGDDGLWVDIYSLRPDDLFRQQHRFVLPDGITGETPALSGVEVPALSGVEVPALSGVEVPALSGVEVPALSGVEVPALSGVEVPALSGVEVPALSGVEVPALSGVEVPALSGVEVAVFGLYDPLTGIRILTESGQDHLKLELP